MAFGNIQNVCSMTKKMYVDNLLRAIPYGKYYLPYMSTDEDENMYKSAAFKYILAVSKELVGFIGLIQLILTFFLLVDMFMTWMHPIKYISSQKRMIPIFILAAKVLQVLIFLVALKFGAKGLIWAFTPIATVQILLTIIFFIFEICAKSGKGFRGKILILIFKRFAFPQICFVMFTILLLRNLVGNEDPLRSSNFTLANVFVPFASIILSVIKAFEPQTAVLFRQICIKYCKAKKISS